MKKNIVKSLPPQMLKRSASKKVGPKKITPAQAKKVANFLKNKKAKSPMGKEVETPAEEKMAGEEKD